MHRTCVGGGGKGGVKLLVCFFGEQWGGYIMFKELTWLITKIIIYSASKGL